MIRDCEVTYGGYTLEYSSVDTSDSVFKCTALLKLEGEDYILLANSDADELIKDFKERVDKHLERVLCLVSELEYISVLQDSLIDPSGEEVEHLANYLTTRETVLIDQIKRLTSAD